MACAPSTLGSTIPAYIKNQNKYLVLTNRVKCESLIQRAHCNFESSGADSNRLFPELADLERLR